jgi:hypothetical protein
VRFRILVADDAEAREECMAGDTYTGPLSVVDFSKLHTHSELRFRAQLPGVALQVEIL